MDSAAALKYNDYELESWLAGHLEKSSVQWRQDSVYDCSGQYTLGVLTFYLIIKIDQSQMSDEKTAAKGKISFTADQPLPNKMHKYQAGIKEGVGRSNRYSTGVRPHYFLLPITLQIVTCSRLKEAKNTINYFWHATNDHSIGCQVDQKMQNAQY